MNYQQGRAHLAPNNSVIDHSAGKTMSNGPHPIQSKAELDPMKKHESKITQVHFGQAELFAKDKKDSHKISSSDPNQQKVGDCWLIAALSSVADSNPDYIERAIKPVPAKGTPERFVVCLHEVSGTPGSFKILGPREISVANRFFYQRPNAQTKSESREQYEARVHKHYEDAGNDKSKHGEDARATEFMYAKPDTENVAGRQGRVMELWPLILESAFAKLYGGFDALDGGFSEMAFMTLTGKTPESRDFGDQKMKSREKNKLWEHMELIAHRNQAVVAYTFTTEQLIARATHPARLKMAYEYFTKTKQMAANEKQISNEKAVYIQLWKSHGLKDPQLDQDSSELTYNQPGFMNGYRLTKLASTLQEVLPRLAKSLRMNEDDANSNWFDKYFQNDKQNGIVCNHAYSVINTRVRHGVRSVHLRNPWGKTPYKKGISTAGTTDGDLGSFWMEFEDFLKYFYRTTTVDLK